MTTLLPAVLPVGLIILVGFIVGRTLPLQRQTLSQLILFVLSPALVIDSLYRTTLSAQNSQRLLLGFALTSLLIYLGIWLLGAIAKLSFASSKALIAATVFANNGNMGLPVVTFALGAPGLERAIVYLIASSILMFCFGPAILQGKGVLYGVKLTLKLPLFWSILVGLSLRWFELKFPFELDTGIQRLGAAAIPIALILLGMQLSTTRFQLGKRELVAIAVRLLISPLIAYGVGSSIQMEQLSLQVLVLQSAMPTAVNSLVIVSEFGGDIDFIARAIVGSTIISFATLPLVLWLLLD
ncbi:AEC family transporter [Myxosarcina sp. GI1]|uniref:AEC family transporter n=1 Tax=Myxosarcina sp. GI1 TaxID=1541065 RepID=UPI000562EC73|nr:AEC family transporter [Myxosarcina sp. GI1]